MYGYKVNTEIDILMIMRVLSYLICVFTTPTTGYEKIDHSPLHIRLVHVFNNMRTSVRA